MFEKNRSGQPVWKSFSLFLVLAILLMLSIGTEKDRGEFSCKGEGDRNEEGDNKDDEQLAVIAQDTRETQASPKINGQTRLNSSQEVTIHGYVDSRQVSKVACVYLNGSCHVYEVNQDEFKVMARKGSIVTLAFTGTQSDTRWFLYLGDRLRVLSLRYLRDDKIDLGVVSLNKEGQAIPGHNPVGSEIKLKPEQIDMLITIQNHLEQRFSRLSLEDRTGR